jgi:hypothetical protein
MVLSATRTRLCQGAQRPDQRRAELEAEVPDAADAALAWARSAGFGQATERASVEEVLRSREVLVEDLLDLLRDRLGFPWRSNRVVTADLRLATRGARRPGSSSAPRRHRRTSARLLRQGFSAAVDVWGCGRTEGVAYGASHSAWSWGATLVSPVNSQVEVATLPVVWKALREITSPTFS